MGLKIRSGPASQRDKLGLFLAGNGHNQFYVKHLKNSTQSQNNLSNHCLKKDQTVIGKNSTMCTLKGFVNGSVNWPQR